ncbi:MAG: GSCFA domain-containing protein [Salinimicrobium sp.]
MLGSCFVENIGQKLEYYKFRSLLNPFGILFHPAAIRNFLEKAVRLEKYSEADLFYHNEQWHCLDAHSDLNSSQKGEILQALNSAVKLGHNFIKEATHIFITPGTAWGYYFRETGNVVANCHKLPQKNFSKKLTDVQHDLQESLSLIRQLNSSAAIIFTVSPVRHLKDGFVENQQSKARLLTAMHEVIASEEKVHYFPSYEIMMDELRDYRFYAEDMLHPNKIAIDYIWEKFRESWIAPDAAAAMKKIEGIQKGLLHRPFNSSSAAHQKFKKDLLAKQQELQLKWPHMKF